MLVAVHKRDSGKFRSAANPGILDEWSANLTLPDYGRVARHPPTIRRYIRHVSVFPQSPASVRLKLCSTDLADLLALGDDISLSRAAGPPFDEGYARPNARIGMDQDRVTILKTTAALAIHSA